MSILFVLLMFLVIITISYFRSPEVYELAARPQPALGQVATPKMVGSTGLAIPQGYWFHPGHTWSLREGPNDARIGIDSFATNLIGHIDRIRSEARRVGKGSR